MTAPTDPYELLGIDHDASPAVIRAAWRRAVRIHHPDGSGNGDPEAFLAIQAAYRQITDRAAIGQPPPQPTSATELRRPTPAQPKPDPFDAADHLLFDTPAPPTRRQPSAAPTDPGEDAAAAEPAAATIPATRQRSTVVGFARHVGPPLLAAIAARTGLVTVAGDRIPILAVPAVVIVAAAAAIGTALVATHHPVLGIVAATIVAVVEAVPLVAPLVAVAIAVATGAHGIGPSAAEESP